MAVHNQYPERTEPIETCQVRVSSTLLLVVLACVITKIVICSVLVWRLNHTSLVTPGDAIESFVSSPDPVTFGASTLSLDDSQSLEYTSRRHYRDVRDTDLSLLPMPRRWLGSSRRLRSATSRRIWVQAYYPIFLFLLCLAVGIYNATPVGYAKDFEPSESSDTFDFFGYYQSNLLGTLMIPNLTQLIVSFCYLAINGLYTQLQVEQEWNSYAQAPKPLRVSYPAGEQISTCRLQLSYRYSVPLIAMGTIIHWLFSNSIFLSIIEGVDAFVGSKSSFGVSESATVMTGVTSEALLATFIVSCVVVISPLLFRFRTLKSQMVIGGTNSLVLSAACHVPRPLRTSSESLPKHISPISSNPSANISCRRKHIRRGYVFYAWIRRRGIPGSGI
ncbi:hypothetical protein PG994_005878 [Apiospora phragmitis]|uniref:Uncharacterized protein n=1 Tax=Apiospora phragmitis TaxID=2905665 RepID=A0ABR1VEH6_9PEZI